MPSSTGFSTKRPSGDETSEPRKRVRPTAHPGNELLSNEPDFLSLAQKYCNLRPFVREVNGKGRINFRNWDAVHALAGALLQEDFGIKDWSIPTGHLIPAIPNRLNYVLWINDLLHLSRTGNATIRGLDIGCGSNLIFPLLGAAKLGWAFTGVDCNEQAVANCHKILTDNPHMRQLIKIHHCQPCTSLEASHESLKHCREPATATCAGNGDDNHQVWCKKGHCGDLPQDSKGPLMNALLADENYDFCMCNPPFFLHMSDSKKNPQTDYGGIASEMACPGGEEVFVMAMVRDSCLIRDRIHWFTTMLGKKSTFKRVRQHVNGLPSVTAVRTMELVQGATRRWVIAWSFTVSRSLAQVPLRAREAVNPS